MITQRHRFHGYGSLKGVYLRGQNLRGGLLNLKYALRDPKKPYRVAVVVSRKVSKSAVVRNRIRRRIYEIVRRLDSDSNDSIRPGTDMIFTAFGDQLATMDAERLEELVNELLRKVSPGQ